MECREPRRWLCIAQFGDPVNGRTPQPEVEHAE
jgi:hypothetical protein